MRPLPGRTRAIAERGSIALTTMRLLRSSSLRHMRGAGKGGGDLLAVAEMEIEPDIARHVVVEQRRAGLRRPRSAR